MLARLQVRLCVSYGAPNGQEHSMRLNPSRTLKNVRCHLRMQMSLVITIDAGTGRVGAENGKIRRVRSSLEGEGPRRSGQERKRLVYLYAFFNSCFLVWVSFPLPLPLSLAAPLSVSHVVYPFFSTSRSLAPALALCRSFSRARSPSLSLSCMLSFFRSLSISLTLCL